MNNRKILEAIQEIDEIGCLSPDASPPDILGVLANCIYKKITWDSPPMIRDVMNRVKVEFDLNSRDSDELLALSEIVIIPSESPKKRQRRLLDVFAARVEDEELLAERDPPEDVNPVLIPDDYSLKGI